MPTKAAQLQQATLDMEPRTAGLDRQLQEVLGRLVQVEKALADWTARVPSVAREVSAIRAEMESALDGGAA